MSFFNSADELNGTLGTFLQKAMAEPEVGKAFAGTNSLMKVVFTDPDVTLWIDCRQNPPIFLPGSAEEPDLELSMTADAGHRFWLGRLSLPVALTSRKIKVKGPTSKLMKILPVLKPIYRRYEEFLNDQGRADLVAV
ncbi:MAG: SCP2 sterol-binding domain-containing protein [Actinomycetota bacterium]